MPHLTTRWKCFVRIAKSRCVLGGCLSPLCAAVYDVNSASPSASNLAEGSAEAPWKSISRAASAKELQAGGKVIIRSGVYRGAALEWNSKLLSIAPHPRPSVTVGMTQK